MHIIDLPEGARILRVTPAGTPTPPAAVDHALEEMDAWYDRLARLSYLEQQVEAVRALTARPTLTGMDIANALDVEHL